MSVTAVAYHSIGMIASHGLIGACTADSASLRTLTNLPQRPAPQNGDQIRHGLPP